MCIRDSGYTGDEVCKTCGVTVKKGEVIPATGHDTELVGAKPATCTQDGYTHSANSLRKPVIFTCLARSDMVVRTRSSVNPSSMY